MSCSSEKVDWLVEVNIQPMRWLVKASSENEARELAVKDARAQGWPVGGTMRVKEVRTMEAKFDDDE